MGANASNTLSETISKSMTTLMSQQLTTDNTGNDITTSSKKEVEIIFDSMNGCKVFFGANTTITVNSTILSDVTMTSAAKAAAQQTVDQLIKAAVAQKNTGGINLGQFNVTNATQISQAVLESDISNIVTNAFTATNRIQTNSEGKSTLTINQCKDSTITWNEQMYISIIAETITNRLMNIAIDMIATQATSQENDISILQSNAGLFAIGNIVAIGLAVMIGAVVYMRGKNQQPSQQDNDTAKVAGGDKKTRKPTKKAALIAALGFILIGVGVATLVIAPHKEKKVFITGTKGNHQVQSFEQWGNVAWYIGIGNIVVGVLCMGYSVV